jgi:hypothetical protein
MAALGWSNGAAAVADIVSQIAGALVRITT